MQIVSEKETVWNPRPVSWEKMTKKQQQKKKKIKMSAEVDTQHTKS